MECITSPYKKLTLTQNRRRCVKSDVFHAGSQSAENFYQQVFYDDTAIHCRHFGLPACHWLRV